MIARKTVIDITARTTPYGWELLSIACGIGAIVLSKSVAARQYLDLLQGGTILFTAISMVDLRQGVRRLHAAITERTQR